MDEHQCHAGGTCCYEQEIEDLKWAVQRLEEARGQEESFRKTYYEDRESRIKRDTELDFKMKLMDEKLDKLLLWQETQQNKPNKLLDGIVEKGIWAVLAAVIAFFLGRAGL